MKCPHCGADVKSNSSLCEYCGPCITAQMIRAQEQLNKAGCPKCGSTNITFNREKQGEVKGKRGTAVVRTTVGVCKDCGYTWQTDSGVTNAKKRKTWLWVLGWICIFPVPLTFLMLRKKDMKPVLKYGIITIAWVLYLIIAMSGQSNTSVENLNTQPEASQTANSQKEIGQIETEPKELGNMEIILMEGHPKYYGSTKQAHEVWGSLKKGVIHFADSYSKDPDAIISMGGYSQGEKNEIIRDIYIRLGEGVSLEEALRVADDYLPYDIIAQWYEFSRSFKTAPNEGSQKTCVDYFVSYHLTQEGSDAYYADKHQYSGSIDVQLSSEDNGKSIRTISIGFGTPRWTGSLSQNGLQEIEWNYDFLKSKD